MAPEEGRRSRRILRGPSGRSARSSDRGLPAGLGGGLWLRFLAILLGLRLRRGLSRPFSALAALLRPLRASGGSRNGGLLAPIGASIFRFGACSVRFPGGGRGQIRALCEAEFDSCGLDHLAGNAFDAFVGSVEVAVSVDALEDDPGRVVGECAAGNGGMNRAGGVSRHSAGA